MRIVAKLFKQRFRVRPRRGRLGGGGSGRRARFRGAKSFRSTQNISNHSSKLMISERRMSSPPGRSTSFSFGFDRIFNHILSFGTGSCEATNLLGPGIGIPGADLDTIVPHAPGVPSGLDRIQQGMPQLWSRRRID